MPTPSLYAYLRNCRAYTQQWIIPRQGIAAINPTPFDQLPVHSIKHLWDKVTGVFPRIYGAGTKLYVNEATVAVDTGYSGNPLAMFNYRPEQSAQPWCYVADSQRMRKVRGDGLVHTIGIEPPLQAPLVTFGAPAFQVISDFEVIAPWTNGGTAGAISIVSRVNTTIARILFDTGTTGWANIQPTAFTSGFQRGMLLKVDAEEVIVDDIYPGFGSSTIGSIVYDSGSTGLCSITPAAAACPKSHFPYQPGLGDGPRQPRSPGRGPQGRPTSQRVYSGTFTADASPAIVRVPKPPTRPPVRSGSTRPLGLQPNSLIRINAGGGTDETVRVLSIAVGKNGLVSFRASTINNHIAGETLAGLSSFRAFCTVNHIAGGTLVKNAFQTTVASGTGFISIVTPFNISVAGGQPVQEEDEIHISINLDHPEFLSEARVFFDVDSSTNDFAHNYFYYALRPSDAQQAVVSGLTNLQSRQAAITKAVTTTYARKIAPRQLGPVYRDGDPTLGGGLDDVGVDPSFRRGGGIPTSSQASTGAGQWTEFRFKVSDMTRVGPDKSQHLANVGGVRIQLIVSSAVIAKIDSLWIGGTYGPDIGDIGAPIFYRIRGRSKVTGVRSLAGPPTRAGIEAHRQRVVVTPFALHPNTSVDTLDVFRFGGSLDQWYYVGSMPNTGTPSFNDDLDDTSVETQPTLDLDLFQPFPTIDLPRSGVVNTVGHKVILVSGNNFNVQWYPGSQININGIFYSLYAQPTDTQHLEIVENAGTLTNVPYFMNNATLLGQSLPSFWGPYSEGTAAFFFACGDSFQPGVLFITNGNDPDSASDTLQIEVCSPSEPLINGAMYDSTPYVFSNEKLFRLYPNIGVSGQLFIPRPVPNAKGLYSRWGLAVGRYIYALGADGIYRTDGQSYDSITNPDLRLLFPHDGVPGIPITIASVTVQPPDMNQLSKLRLSAYDDVLYFDFQDVQGVQRTLFYDEIFNVWGVDDYNPPVLYHYGEEGENLHGLILGGNNGIVFNFSGVTTDSGVLFPMEVRFPQISELATSYQQVPDGIVGLISNSIVNLVENVDGVDFIVTLASTAGVYSRFYTRLVATKGKLLAFALSAPQGFSLNRRDCQFRCGAWGRQQTQELVSSGSMVPINPFADLRRSYGPKVG